MQMSKCVLLVCAAAYGTAVLPLHAADADTDTKLREALEMKLNELRSQPPAATPKPGVMPPSSNTPSFPAANPALSAPPADSEAIAKAREALHQKMKELELHPGGRPAPPGQWTPPPVVRPAPPVTQPKPTSRAAQPKPTVAQPAVAGLGQPTPQPVLASPSRVSDQSIAKARESLRQKMNELEAQSPAPTTAPTSVAAATPVVAQPPAPAAGSTPVPAKSTPKTKSAEAKPGETAAKPPAQAKAQSPSQKPAKAATAFPPIQAPPPAISADKASRLADLLRKYKADEITPEEYHQQRTKILGER